MSDRYYGWRDIGTGPRRTEPLIKNVIGNFDYMKDEQMVEPPPGCEFCGIVLTYFDKIKKRICTRCGHPMTDEDKRILDGIDTPIKPTIDKQKVLPNNDIEIDDTGSTATATSIRKNEEGFRPMKRGANSDVVTSREQAGGIGSTFIKKLPSRGGKKQNLYETPNGKLIPLDADRQKMINQGKIITDAEDIIPSGPGVIEAISSNELRQRESPEYRECFRKYDESSGLSVGGKGRSNSDKQE